MHGAPLGASIGADIARHYDSIQGLRRQAVPLGDSGAMPGWSYGPAREGGRYAERFRLEVFRQREQIERIVAPSSEDAGTPPDAVAWRQCSGKLGFSLGPASNPKTPRKRVNSRPVFFKAEPGVCYTVSKFTKEDVKCPRYPFTSRRFYASSRRQRSLKHHARGHPPHAHNSQ